VIVGRESSVGIATRYVLDGLCFEYWCPAYFSAPVQIGLVAHPAFCIMGTGILSREVKWPKSGVDHPPHLVLMLKKEYSYTSTSLLDLHGMFMGEFHICLYSGEHYYYVYIT
jgi:hypothetical protein